MPFGLDDRNTDQYIVNYHLIENKLIKKVQFVFKFTTSLPHYTPLCQTKPHLQNLEQLHVFIL